MKPSRTQLEQWAIGDLGDAAQARVEEAMSQDAALRERALALRHRILNASVPALRLPSRPRMPRWAPWTLAAIGALAVALLVVSLPRSSTETVFRGPLSFEVEMVRMHLGSVQPVFGVVTASTGDRLQWTIECASAGFLHVFDVQEDGSVEVWLPSRPVRAGERIDGAVLLDAYEGQEKIVFEGAAQAIAEVLEAANASLLVLNEDGDALEVASNVGGGVPIDEMSPAPIGDSVAGVAFEADAAFAVEALDEDPRFAAHARRPHYASGSFAAAPLVRAGERFGVLCATDRAGGERFSQDDAMLLRVLALQIGDLMAAAGGPAPAAPASTAPDPTLEIQADAAADRDAELARIVCDACAHEVEPDVLLSSALAALSRELPAAPAALFLLDAQSGDLVLEAECDGGESADRERLPTGRGLTGAVFSSAGLVAAAHPEDDPRFDAEVDTPADGESASLLCLPIVLRGKAVGVFRAFLAPRRPGVGAHRRGSGGRALGGGSQRAPVP